MRLHRLAVTGFGPFRDEQVVDFDALSTTGLFLLTGDTGAGKSSILDAVAYALYGRVAGSRASATRIRSDHADPERPTTVELDLSLRGQRFRVSRAPEWERRKVRGSGTTKQPAKVVLERFVDGQWELVSNRADEVGHELGELLGMNHQQFCQVVLLPQGDFAQFLRADAETRKRLLERLFGTERFSAVEGWLVDRRRERGQELSAVDREVDGTVARLAEVTGDPTARPATDDLPAMTAWTQRQVATLDLALAADQAELMTARRARSAAVRRLGTERGLGERQDRLAGLRERAEALSAAAPQMEQSRHEVAAARRAAGLAVLLDAVAASAETAAAARADATVRTDAARRCGIGTRSVLTARGRDQLDRLDEVGELEAAEHDVRAEIVRLEDLRGDEQHLLEQEVELRAAEDTVTDLEADIGHHQTWLADAPERIAALDQRRASLRVLVQSAPGLQAEHGALGPRITAGRRRDRLAADLGAAADRRRAAVDAAQAAREAWQDLRERRLAAMAGEIAAMLDPGAPCPVCGATEHPSPAASAAEAVVDAAREGAALADLERAERARDDRSREHDVLTEALQEATMAAGGADLPEVMAARRKLLAGQLEEAGAAAAELTAAERSSCALIDETAEHRQALTAANEAYGRAAQRAADLRESTVGLRRSIDTARGDFETVAARIAACIVAVEALAAARGSVVLASSAEIDVARAVGRAERAAEEAGFPDLDAAADAQRDPAVVDALVASLEAHDHEAVLVGNAMRAPDLVGTTLDPRADPDAAEREAAAAADDADDANARVGVLAANATAVSRLTDQLGSQLRARAPLQDAFATVDNLSRLADGTNTENRLRMRLSYFVLSARLEQVAAAASERLLRMTDGRFSLVHSDDRAAGNQRSGLGLAVCDAWYGTTRDPATLSGGESFMASLALALGLADVVVAEAGGAFMDTLFVDEGFGSLDESTLDAVLDVLDGLREGGRAVGLVSHVGELRQRVPTRLAVRRGRAGSTLTLSA